MLSHPRVALRGDGGAVTGSGHLARLSAIAGALLGRGVRTELVPISDRVPKSNFSVIHRLARPEDPPSTLEVELPLEDQHHDAAATAALLGPEPLAAIISDSYRLGEPWQEATRANRSCPVVAIDDLDGRCHNVDLLIDPNLGRSGSGPKVTGDRRVLRGPAYVPLSSDYHRPLGMGDPPTGPRIVIALGGGRSGLLAALSPALRTHPRLKGIALDIIVPDPIERAEVESAMSGHANARVLGRLESLARVMAGADLVIGAGGTSLWERLRLGLPSVVIPLSQNQERGCEAVAALGLAIAVPRRSPVSPVVAAAAEALDDPGLRRRASAVGPILVDGRGAARIALALFPPLTKPRLRSARTEDASALFAIRNDREVRHNSRNTAQVDPLARMDWFAPRLSDPRTLQFVAESGDLIVGQVRFDQLVDGAWELSYALDASARGNRWGGHIVDLGVRALTSERSPVAVVAQVREENLASRRTFERLGFRHDPDGAEATAFGVGNHRGFTAYVLRRAA